jgi:hypothetical protein
MSILGATDLGNGKLLVTVDHDPTAIATDCPMGSMIVNVSTGYWYRKQDDGSTINVRDFYALEQKVDGVSSSAARVQEFQFGRDVKVPGGGTLSLYGPGNSTVGVRVNRAGTITGASIQVDVADAGRSYLLEIYKNGGAAVATVALVNVLGNHANAFAVAVVAGDVLTAALVLTAGAGASTFTNAQATIEVMF